jgi:pimeloyl-ACP methyl ester carboxylesterase
MGRIGKHSLAGLLVSLALLAGACQSPGQTTQAPNLATSSTAPLGKPCLGEAGSARPFRFRTPAGAVLVGVVLGRGQSGIVLVGSSMGATAVLSAATRIRPPVSGVVSLSGPGAFGAVSVWQAMPRLRVPVLFVAAADDEPFAGAARAMYRRAGAADKRLLIVRHGHGSTMLAYRDTGPPGRRP